MNMNAQAIFDRIQNALSLAKRDDRVDFVAVSKTRTIDEMKEAEIFPQMKRLFSLRRELLRAIS